MYASSGGRRAQWHRAIGSGMCVFVAEHLALLLVLRRQVEKEKEARVEVDRSTRSASTGVPKATPLKRAFRKLWARYEPSLKLYMQAERDEENVVHCTPSLSLQPVTTWRRRKNTTGAMFTI